MPVLSGPPDRCVLPTKKKWVAGGRPPARPETLSHPACRLPEVSERCPGLRNPFPRRHPRNARPEGGDGARSGPGAPGSYSAARASAALPSGGILRVMNTFMTLTGLIDPAAAGYWARTGRAGKGAGPGRGGAGAGGARVWIGSGAGGTPAPSVRLVHFCSCDQTLMKQTGSGADGRLVPLAPRAYL